MRAWIFRVSLNAAKDLQRNAWRRRARPMGDAPPPEVEGKALTPGDALDDATRILEVTAGVLLVAFALLLPLGLVGLLVWLAARQAAQRRRERALDAV